MSLKYQVQYCHTPPLSSNYDDLLEMEIKRIVTPEDAQQIIGCSHGKCNFMLLPNGDLRLRVYVNSQNGYQFFCLGPEFQAILKED